MYAQLRILQCDDRAGRYSFQLRRGLVCSISMLLIRMRYTRNGRCRRRLSSHSRTSSATSCKACRIRAGSSVSCGWRRRRAVQLWNQVRTERPKTVFRSSRMATHFQRSMNPRSIPVLNHRRLVMRPRPAPILSSPCRRHVLAFAMSALRGAIECAGASGNNGCRGKSQAARRDHRQGHDDRTFARRWCRCVD